MWQYCLQGDGDAGGLGGASQNSRTRLYFHEREYTAQLDPPPAALIHVLFDGVCHDSKKFSVGKCHCCDFICSAGQLGGD